MKTGGHLTLASDLPYIANGIKGYFCLILAFFLFFVLDVLAVYMVLKTDSPIFACYENTRIFQSTLQQPLPDGSCNAGSLPNGFKAASLTAWKQERNPTFDQMVVAIQDGPVSVGIKVRSCTYR